MLIIDAFTTLLFDVGPREQIANHRIKMIVSRLISLTASSNDSDEILLQDKFLREEMKEVEEEAEAEQFRWQ